MTLQEITNELNKMKYGRYFKVQYCSVDEKSGYSKETSTIGRFVDYSHIKGVKPTGKSNPNETTIIKHKLVYNKNTNAYCLFIAVPHIPNCRPKTTYKDDKGNAITKDEYFQVVKAKKGKAPDTVWKLNIDKVVSIG